MAYTFHQATLANGLTIVAEVDPLAHSAAAGFFVKTGARDEATPVMGVSHFLEHMMFKGTGDITAEELNQRFDAMGAKNNAYTSNEITCFYAHLLPELAGEGLDLLSRMMRPALRQSDFDTEKGVILEEIAMYDDNPFFILYEAVLEKHFGAHTLSHRVLGTNQSITNLTRDQMQSYFDNRYSADNTVVALAGKVDFQSAVSQIDALCGSWRKTSASRNNASPKLAGEEFTMRSEKVNRGYLLAMCPAPAFDDDRRYAAGLVSQVLGMPDNSLLHWALIEPGLAEDAQAVYDGNDGSGQCFVFAACDPERIDEVWEVTQQAMQSVRDSLKQEDLDRLLAKTVTGATISGERPHDRMHRLGRVFTYLRKYWPLEEELDRLSRVSLADMRAYCDAFPLKPVTVGRLLPKA
ncbi:zinc protease [Phycisphaerae bacterium]|jgi:predicted Zn-dependent peptidase|nr:zinc protease [Phycisphaerae bacterium]